jgi:hypothetical protein
MCELILKPGGLAKSDKLKFDIRPSGGEKKGEKKYEFYNSFSLKRG